jgi:glucose-6-phosphate dehydrogenase assembly protein OpcA
VRGPQHRDRFEPCVAPCAARLRDLKKSQKDWMSWRRRVLPQHSRQTVDNWIKIAQHRELTASAGNRPASVREALSIIKKALAESGWNTIVARDEQERRSEPIPP